MNFKPAEWTVATSVVTSVMVVTFLVSLLLSFWGGQLWARILCPILFLALLACWLFSVKGYSVARGTISVEHPLWSDRFEVRGVAPEDHRPGGDAVRLFASNWVFGHTLGLCYSKKTGSYLVFMTNPEYRLDLETGRGLLVISPRDKAALSSALFGPAETQHL